MDVPPGVLHCVAFIASRTRNRQEELAGTCVLLSRETSDPRLTITYAVTARHVVDGIIEARRDPLLRVNLKGAGKDLFPFPRPWRFHTDDDVDLAVTCINPLAGDDSQVEWEHFSLPWFVVDPLPVNSRDPRDITAGDDIFATGLFYQHSGARRNIPIIRIGTIAALPEERVLAQVGTEHNPRAALVDAYLAEIHSQMGLSGSPVFVAEQREAGFMRGIRYPGTLYTPKSNRAIYLLGILSGHFDTKLAVIEARGGEKAKTNVGISVIVPYTKLVELFNGPEILEAEKKAVASFQREHGAIMDAHDTTEKEQAGS